jgi:hypothetical protein
MINLISSLYGKNMEKQNIDNLTILEYIAKL